jgi:hypothetical protein
VADGNTSYAPPNEPSIAARSPAPPPNEPSIAAHAAIHSALINAGASPEAATTLTAISGAESGFGKSVVSPVNSNGSRDYGVFQVNNKAWPQFGGPAIATAPLSEQAAAAVHIWNTQGPKAWSTYNNGAYKNYLGAANAAAKASGYAPTPSQQSQPSAPQPTTVGGALGWLTAQNPDTGKSPLQNLSGDVSKDLGGGQQQQQQQPQAPSLAPQLEATQAAAAGNPLQQEIAAKAQQMGAQLLHPAQGLAWGSGPPGGRAGQQALPMTMGQWGFPVPGVTLNSGGPGV